MQKKTDRMAKKIRQYILMIYSRKNMTKNIIHAKVKIYKNNETADKDDNLKLVYLKGATYRFYSFQFLIHSKASGKR